MATIVNDRAVALRDGHTRNLNPTLGKSLFLIPSSPVFHTAAGGGSGSPTTITLNALPFGMVAGATVSWSVTAGGTLTGTAANIRTLAFTDMTVDSVTVTATYVENGVTYSRDVIIQKVYDGASGSTTYTWIKYADDAVGTGLSDSPAGKTYIGLAQNKTTAAESTTASDYSWSLIKGTDGVPGSPGADGVTLYTWIKYSDVADGTGLYDTPTSSTLYIGIAVNKTTATESTVKTDYVWSKFRGDQGVPGTSGSRGAGHFYAVGSSWTDGTADAACPGGKVVNDVVTISNGTTFVMEKHWDGSAWTTTAVVIDGGLIVPGSITANKINVNGLEIHKPDGTPIVTTSGLQSGFEAPGTLNSAVSIGANGQLNNGAGSGGQVTIGGLGYTGALDATKGADASNLKVGLGGKNLIPANSLPNSTTNFYATDYAAGLGGDGPHFASGSDTFAQYALSNAGNVWIHIAGTPVTGASFDVNRADTFLVTPGTLYEFGVNLSTHRCQGAVKAFFYDASNNYISESTGNSIAYAWDTSLAVTTAQIRSFVIIAAPATATHARIGARLTTNGGNEPYVFASQWYFGEALSSQTTPSPWSESAGGVAAINTSLSQKLVNNAANILSGGAGLAVGSLTWNSSGVRTGGYGVGITSYGIVAYNSGGTATFTLEAATGNATFGGTLSAANMVNTSHLVDNSVSSMDIFGAFGVGLAATSKTFVVSGTANVLVTGQFGELGTGVHSAIRILNSSSTQIRACSGPDDGGYSMAVSGLPAGTYTLEVTSGEVASAYVQKALK